LMVRSVLLRMVFSGIAVAKLGFPDASSVVHTVAGFLGQNRTDRMYHPRNIRIAELRRQWQADGLPPQSRRIRPHLRLPSNALLVERMFRHGKIVHPGTNAMRVHRVEEIIA